MKKVMFWESSKKLVFIMMAMVFCYLAIIGKISGEQFLGVFMVVITFYYNYKSKADTTSTTDKSEDA